VIAHLHFAKDAFALQLLFQRTKRLINIVVANEYLHGSLFHRYEDYTKPQPMLREQRPLPATKTAICPE